MAGGLWGPWPGAKTNKQKRKAQQKAFKKKKRKLVPMTEEWGFDPWGMAPKVGNRRKRGR